MTSKQTLTKYLDGIIKGSKPKTLEKYIQKSYIEVNKSWKDRVKALSNMGITEYKIVKETFAGENMVTFDVSCVVSTIGIIQITPNVIRERGKWGVNPTSALRRVK